MSKLIPQQKLSLKERALQRAAATRPMKWLTPEIKETIDALAATGIGYRRILDILIAEGVQGLPYSGIKNYLCKQRSTHGTH